MESSSFGNIVGVFIEPTKTFQSLSQHSRWLVALIVIIGLAAGVSFAMFDKVDGEEMMRTQIEQSGRQLSDQEMETTLAMGDKVKYFAPVATLLMIPALYLVTAALFLVALKIQGSEMTFAQSFSTCLHGLMPLTLQGLLMLPVIFFKEEIPFLDAQSGSILMSNLGFLATDDTSAAMRALFGSVDLFSFWSIALLGLGYSVVARVSKPTAYTTAALVWLLGVTIKVLTASLGS